MKRFSATIAAFFALLAVIYSGFWFYQSKKVKSFAELYVSDMTKKFGGDKSQFIYADSKSGGFPLSFKVEFVKPKLIINDRNLEAELVSEGAVVFKSNIIGSKFTVSLPKELNFKKKDDAKSALLAKFNEEPAILIRGKQKGLIPWLMNSTADADDLPWVMTEFSYSDKGFDIMAAGGATISSARSSEVDLKMDDSNSYSLVANIKNMQLDKLIALPSYADALGNLNIAADMSYKESAGSEEAAIDVKRFSLVADGFSVDISGNIERNKADALPFGVMQVKLGQYESFISYNAALINYVVANSAFPIFSINNKQIDSTKEFLKSIASEKYNDDKDILILLNRKKGEDFRIGQVGFYEALQRFKLDVNGATASNRNAAKIVVPNAM
jgi:hypothetical protein